jgi:hypothetical protein
MATTKLTIELINVSIEADDPHSAVAALMARIGKALQQFNGADEEPQVIVASKVGAKAAPLPTTATPELQETPTITRGRRKRLILECVQKPGWRGTVEDAAKLASCLPETVRTAMSSGRTAGGLTFKRTGDVALPEQHARTHAMTAPAEAEVWECDACGNDATVDAGELPPQRCTRCSGAMHPRGS